MQQKKFPLGQSSSYIMRKVWYHQIVIQNNLGFMVLILIYIPWSWPKFGSHNIKLFQWLNVHWDHNISWHTYVHIFRNFVQSDIKWIWMWLHTAWPDPIWEKVKTSHLLLPQHQSTYPRDPESVSIEIPPFKIHLIKFSKSVFYYLNLVSQCSHLNRVTFTK